MSAFEFLHAADLHLDSPLRGLDADAPAERIRGATREALVRLVDLALERNVAFLVLAGDLYDGDWKDWRTGHFLVEQLARCRRAGIPVIAIAGNHDAEQVLTKKLPFPGTLMRASRPDTHRLEHLRVAIHGQSFATRAVSENLALGYNRPVEDWFNIGLLHTACGSKDHDNYAPCSTAELASLGYQYWALGHVHARAVLSTDPWIVFPGNLQGRHVNEEGAKGATLVRVSDGQVAAAPEHHALDVLRWRRLDIDCSGAADLDGVSARVTFLLGVALADADGRLLIVRLTLLGACAAHAALARDLDATLQVMRAAACDAADTAVLWIEGVRVRTAPVLDEAALLRGGGAVGALLAALAGPPKLAVEIQEHAADLLRRAGSLITNENPAHAIAAGLVPDEMAARARGLLLAELCKAAGDDVPPAPRHGGLA